MSTKTVYDVIDTGVNYLLSVYDSWNIEDVLDKEMMFSQYITLAIWTCFNYFRFCFINGRSKCR